MLAFNSKTGAPILGALDDLQCRPEIVLNSWSRGQGGTVDFEWEGGSEVFWDTSTTVTVGGAASVADDLLLVSKSAAQTVFRLINSKRERGEPDDQDLNDLLSQIQAVVLRAEAPRVSVYLDSDGEEVPETEIELRDEDDEEAET